jgi:hypothetical protein
MKYVTDTRLQLEVKELELRSYGMSFRLSPPQKAATNVTVSQRGKSQGMKKSNLRHGRCCFVSPRQGCSAPT